MGYIGVVSRGGQRARTLGFPTINIPLPDLSISGSYAGSVVCEGETYPAVLYADPGRMVLEAHLLDFSSDLYGKTVAMTLAKKLREVKQFENDAALVAAIQRDILETKKFFEDSRGVSGTGESVV